MNTQIIRRILLLGAVIVGLILLMVCIGMYFMRTVDVYKTKTAVDVETPNVFIEDNLFTRIHYLQYRVMPTNFIEPDAVYRLSLDNGIVKKETKVFWSELELGINKPKVVKQKITEDEYTALRTVPWYDTSVSEIRPERNFSYIATPCIYFCILILWGIVEFGRKTVRQLKSLPVLEPEVIEPVISISREQKQAERCLQCSEIKVIAGVLRCSRDKCKYD